MSKKVQCIFGEKFILALLCLAVFRLSVFKIPFNLFCMGKKRLLQSSLGNEVDFRDIMNVSLNILAKN